MEKLIACVCFWKKIKCQSIVLSPEVYFEKVSEKIALMIIDCHPRTIDCFCLNFEKISKLNMFYSPMILDVTFVP